MKTAIYNMQTNGIAMSEKNLFSFFFKNFYFQKYMVGGGGGRGTEGLAQLVRCLSSRCEALSSNLST
jgi:hypothetical protein